MRRWTVVLTALVALAAPSLAADAQTPPDLAAALSLARPPARGIAIAVGADAIHLSKGAAAPATDTPVTTIAAAFGQITHTFGDVIAVGPSTMVAINTNPVAPNPLSGIQPWDAFKMLAASLSDAQWQRLTSAGGVGMADLRSDWQRSLFASIFPHSVTIVKLPGRGLPGQELSPEDLLQCRLKLQQETDVTFQAEGMPSKSAVTGGSPTRPNLWPDGILKRRAGRRSAAGHGAQCTETGTAGLHRENPEGDCSIGRTQDGRGPGKPHQPANPSRALR